MIPQTKEIKLFDQIAVGGKAPLLIIAGPCQIESRDHSLRIAEFLRDLCVRFPVGFVFKASFDKANRSSLTGKRGLGLDSGLRILEEVRSTCGVPVITDVHTAEQAQLASDVVDILQTPAFLCRQTDLLLAVGKTGKPAHLKKGQFLHPSDMKFVAEKVASTGNDRIMLCERGSSFGYRDLVVDMRSLALMRAIGYPVIFDATHSVQQLGGESGASGGMREYVALLGRSAIAAGIDGLFVECHPEPNRAPSDGKSMLPLGAMEKFISSACRIWEAARSE